MNAALKAKLASLLTPEELACVVDGLPARPQRGRNAGAKNGGRYGEGSVFRVPKDDPSGKWYAALYVGGVQKSWSSGSTKKADAVALLAEKREALRRGGITRDVLMSEVLNDVIQDYAVRGHRSLDDAEQRVRMHLGPFFSCTNDEPAFKKRKLEEGLNEEQVTEELRRRRLQGLTKFSRWRAT